MNHTLLKVLFKERQYVYSFSLKSVSSNREAQGELVLKIGCRFTF